MDALLKEIGQVAIFLICAQTLLHFRAKDSYEKYIKLLISMMLLILLAEPFWDFMDMQEGMGFSDRIENYGKSIEEVMGKGLLQEDEIEKLLQGITEETVAQGIEQVQKQQEEVQQEATTAVEMKASEQTQIIIEKIEIGGQNGES